jgi:hypothetical protein
MSEYSTNKKTKQSTDDATDFISNNRSNISTFNFTYCATEFAAKFETIRCTKYATNSTAFY